MQKFLISCFVLIVFSTPFLAAQELDHQNLVDLIKKENLTDISSTLNTIAKKYPEFFERDDQFSTTFFYRSRSAQDASPLYPRVVIGQPEKFVFTFNGDSSQFGYASLETVTIQGGIMSFREVLFKKDRRQMPGHLQDTYYDNNSHEVEFEDQNIIVSKNNPAKCLACHGVKSPNLVWTPYFFWPGMYGSLNNSYVFNKHFVNPNSQREVKFWNSFKASAPDHPRYEHLVLDKAEFDNKKMTAGFSKSNAQRIVRQILADQELNPFIYLISALVFSRHYPYTYIDDKTSGYEVFQRFIPEAVLAQLEITPEKVWKHQKDYFDNKVNFFKHLINTFKRDFDADIYLNKDEVRITRKYYNSPLYDLFHNEIHEGKKYGYFRLRSYEPRFDLVYALYQFLGKNFEWAMSLGGYSFHFNDGTFFNSFYEGFQSLTQCRFTNYDDKINESKDCNVKNRKLQRTSLAYIQEHFTP